MSLPISPQFVRTFSHTLEAEKNTLSYREICKEGESILYNYWISKNMAYLSYLVLENGEFVKKEWTGPIGEIQRFWKYCSCTNKF